MRWAKCYPKVESNPWEKQSLSPKSINFTRRFKLKCQIYEVNLTHVFQKPCKLNGKNLRRYAPDCLYVTGGDSGGQSIYMPSCKECLQKLQCCKLKGMAVRIASLVLQPGLQQPGGLHGASRFLLTQECGEKAVFNAGVLALQRHVHQCVCVCVCPLRWTY